MNSIERRKLMKAAAVSGIALSISGAASLLAPNGARAQGAPPPAAGWPNRRLLDLLKIDHPIVQAPMGGAVSPSMPVAVCASGALGSFPCSFLTVAKLRDVVAKIRAQTRSRPPEPQLLLRREATGCGGGGRMAQAARCLLHRVWCEPS